MTHVAVAAAVRVLPRETRHLLSFLVLLTFCSIFFFFCKLCEEKKRITKIVLLVSLFQVSLFCGWGY